MKRINKLYTTCIILIISSSYQVTAGYDPLINGSFEDGYTGWDSTAIGRTTDEAYHGSYSMKIKAGVLHDHSLTAPELYSQYIQQDVEYPENTFGELRIYAKQPAAGEDGHIYITLTYVSDGQTKTEKKLEYIYVTWQRVSIFRSDISDNDITITNIKIESFLGESDEVYLYVDNVQILSPPTVNTPPTGPDTVYQYLTYKYQFYATTPDSTSIILEIDWGDGWIEQIERTSNVFADKYHGYATTGVKLIQFRAKVLDSEWSDWSPVKAVTVVTQPPPPPPRCTPGGTCIQEVSVTS